jgi:hypothetical protein
MTWLRLLQRSVASVLYVFSVVLIDNIGASYISGFYLVMGEECMRLFRYMEGKICRIDASA